MSRFLLFVALLATPVTFAAESSDERPDEVVMVSETDAAMNSAIERARSSLDEFLSIFNSKPEGTSGFKLKVELTDSNGSEHFWVIPFKQSGVGFEGTLANEPMIVKGYKLGQTIRFTRENISDWGYVKNGRQVGSFTVCFLLKSAPKEQADYYRDNHGFDC